jgi:GNAT superfamily N-acetyltransferase
METQVVLYIYSFPSYLREQPRVKIGRTSGSVDADPTQLAWQRIRAQVRTSHPEEPHLLGAIKIPDERVESVIHSQLTAKGYHVAEAPGIEWFRFPNQQDLQDFVNKLYRAVIFDDFSELVGGRRDIEGDSFESVVAAFGVRKLSGSEFRRETELVRMLDNELSPLYSNFPQWLDRTMSDSNAVFNVAYRDRQAIGVAIWKPKSRGIAKLSTLYVCQDFRRSGIGRNLILTCFEQWKTESIRRAFVTTAKVELIPFFERYGFWVEGIGREIYEREGHQPEWFLTKLLFYDSDTNELDAINKARYLFPSIIGSSYNSEGRKEITQIQYNDATIDLLDSDANPVHRFSLHSWLNLTYPAESVYAPKTAYVIPIRPQFLIQIFQAGKTVYYGKPTCVQDDMRGASILFYASRPISGVVAIARIVNRYIGTSAQLYNDLGIRGVLTLEQIGGEGQIRHAVEFDFLMPLRQAISRIDLLSNGVLNGTPQTMHSISLQRYKRAVEIGGIYAG